MTEIISSDIKFEMSLYAAQKPGKGPTLHVHVVGDIHKGDTEAGRP